MNPKRLFLSPPHMGGQELHYIHQAFESNYIAPLGEHVDAFEKELCKTTKVAHAAVLSTGTAAIHPALIMLGVSRHDLVICRSFTFAGTVNPVIFRCTFTACRRACLKSWLLRRNFQSLSLKRKTYA